MKRVKKAAALKYNPPSDTAPRVVAVGKGEIAERIVEIAQLAGITIHRDTTLAEILSQLGVNSEIPTELYGVVAEIFAFVYRLEQDKCTN